MDCEVRTDDQEVLDSGETLAAMVCLVAEESLEPPVQWRSQEPRDCPEIPGWAE